MCSTRPRAWVALLPSPRAVDKISATEPTAEGAVAMMARSLARTSEGRELGRHAHRGQS
jgi:ubiquinone biosynthesis protein UbiJ